VKATTIEGDAISENRKTILITVLLVLAFLALAQMARGVVPPPDGGYPGGNTAEGQNALFSLTSGTFNTAIGFLSLRSNIEGNFNTAVGGGALLSNTSGLNTAIGAGALLNNTAPGNTAIGGFALLNNTTGFDNTAIGQQALFSNTTGHENIALGVSAGGAVSTAHDVICIGHPGDNVSSSCFIGHIRNVTTQNADAIPVYIDHGGQLGTISSSRRSKKEIRPMERSSESILALKPVTFNYKSDATNTPQFGLIAEDVAHVNPDLVVRDENGDIYTVRYDAVNAMLLNEFLKDYERFQEQQTKINKQEATIADLKLTVAQHERKMKVLAAQLEEQASRMATINARIDTSNGTPNVALNDP
jgi:uncharacterized coiled-coil protein SlyX